MNIVFCFAPVLIFLVSLFLLDSFKLVRKKTLAICLIYGLLCAGASYFLNSDAAERLNIDFNVLSKYIAPAIEETLKALFIYYLISGKKIGFMIDAAIYGFAIGTGFSLVENIYYLFSSPVLYSPVIWIIRGFGTAIMHGGCTAIMAMLFITSISRSGKRFLAFLPALLIAVLLHAGFNFFPLNPALQTLLIAIILPVVFWLLFSYSNNKLQQWLEIEFNSEAELLGMIRKGQFRSTKAGDYLLSLKEKFPPETIVDMYCYIDLYLELSIKSKRNVMLRENDFPVIVEEDIPAKLEELAQLRKQIGSVGEFALAPLIRMNYRNLWKLNQLQD